MKDVAAKGEYFSIGVLAQEFNVTLRALRFYESKGLLKPKRQAQLRLYTAEDRTRLTQILKGKQLGFTLLEICKLIADGGNDPDDILLGLSREQFVDQIKLLEQRKNEIAQAIAELHALCQNI